MAGDTKKAADLEKRWYQNADEIATLLGCINPYWSREALKEMFFIHLGFVKAMAVYMINGDYEESVNIYDEFELEALEMADMMSKGIIKQFPGKFYY